MLWHFYVGVNILASFDIAYFCFAFHKLNDKGKELLISFWWTWERNSFAVFCEALHLVKRVGFLRWYKIKCHDFVSIIQIVYMVVI